MDGEHGLSIQKVVDRVLDSALDDFRDQADCLIFIFRAKYLTPYSDGVLNFHM